MKKKLVIIPTYNEIENIETMIRTVFGLSEPFDILIVDDGSPDGTGGIVKRLMAGEFAGRLHILERSGKQGLGTAYIAGFRWALAHGYDYVFEMDCDFSHPPEKLIELYKACDEGGADLAIGSRYVRGGKVVNWPLGRILMSYFASVYVRTVTFINVRDFTAGFVCFRRRVLETIDLGDIRMRGYGFQIEMKYKAKRLGFKVAEVPISFTDRTAGNSKMSGGIFGEAFLGVLKMRFRKVRPAAEAGEVKDNSK